MQYFQNKNKFKKCLLSHSAILVFALFNSSSLYAQECGFDKGQIIGKGNNSTIDIKDRNKITIDGKECDYKGQFDTVAGGIDQNNANIANNKITISNDQTIYYLYGGKANLGNVFGNDIVVDNASIIWQVYGGHSATGNVYQNTLTLKNGANTASVKVYAGYSTSGEVYNNKLILENVTPKTKVYGGYSGSGNAKGNSVNIKGNSILDDRAYGGYSDFKDAIGNSISITDNAKTQFLYGGYATNGTALGNKVIIDTNTNIKNGFYKEVLDDYEPPAWPDISNPGPIIKPEYPQDSDPIDRNVIVAIGGATGDNGKAVSNTVELKNGVVDTIMGGSSFKGLVSQNLVILSGGLSAGTVYGGSSTEGLASYNTVKVTSNSYISNGPIIGGSTSAGSVENNSVIILAGEIKSDIKGGENFSSLPNAKNAVYIKGGTVSSVYGGYNYTDGDINNNYIEITNGTINGSVYGGYSGVTFENSKKGKGVNQNAVKITGGTVKQNIYGGYSLSNTQVKENIVEIYDGNIDSNVYGGYSEHSDVINNTVKILGGDIQKDIYGGYSQNGKALDNTVILAGGKISSKVYASAGKNASGTIVLEQGVDVSQASLYGNLNLNDSNLRSAFKTNSNTLQIDGWSGSINAISGFDSINFKNIIWQENPILTIKDLDSSNILQGTKVSIEKITIPTDTSIEKDDKLTIFNDKILSDKADIQNDTIDIFQGVSQMGTSTIGKDGNLIYIGINDIWLNPQNKLVAENRAVASAFINQGNDVISDKLDTLSYSNETGFSVFASTYGNASEYDTLSNFKINGFSSILGMGYKNEFEHFNLSFLAFYENSIGNYRTYNNFGKELFKGFGELESNGGAIAAKFEFHNGFYTETSFRAGNLKSSMQNALKDSSGNTYGYELNSAYYGAHIGAGKQFSLNQTFAMDIYSKLFYTHTAQDSFSINKERFHFDSINSTRARIGLKSDAKINDKFKVYAGAAYEYEFNGVANMQIDSYNLSEQSLKGSSYMAELGLNYQASKNLNLDIKGRGYLGKREGVSGTLSLNYKF